MDDIRLFFALAQRAFRRALAYRTAALAGLITNFVFGLIRAAVLVALYGDRTIVEGYTLAGVITYTGLTQALITYLSIFGWYDLMNTIHSGEIGSDLLKPMGLFTYWMARDLGRAVAGLLMRGLTIMGLYALLFDIVVPDTAARWLWLALTLSLSWLVSFAFRFLWNLTAFWSPNAQGYLRFVFFVALFFAGFLVPLNFLPVWVQRIALLTPFPTMLDTVVEVYLGVATGPALRQVILLQVAWAVGLIGLSQLVLRRGVRRLAILGG